MPTLVINNKSLHFLDVGTGEPLLFGHSFLWDHRMWEAQIEALSPHFRCIIPDLWGHGRSASLECDEYSIEALADDYWQLMRSLDLPHFSVIGLSVGGMWAAELAIKHPAAVKSLVLMDTYLGEEPAQTKALYLSMLDQVAQAGKIPEPMIGQLVNIFLSPVTLKTNPQLAADLEKALREMPARQIPSVVTLGRAIFSRPDRLANLGNLTAPTLILVGEHDQPRPVSEADSMARHLPNARLNVIPNAGHIPAKEQPAAVNQQLLHFLNQEKSSGPDSLAVS